MKVLLFGTDGQLGIEVQRGAGGAQIEARGLDVADFTNPDACVAFVEATDADVVINASAYTAVDKAEEMEELAHQINAATPGRLAQAAAKRNLPFVHVSTDYVFDGTGETAFLPDDPTGPLGVYGRTKLEGEEAIRAAGGPHTILRTSWVVSAHGNNFIKTMLRLGAEREALTIVADQIGGPTPARALAEACLSIAAQLCETPEKTGTYHFSGAPDVSWADFAREIFAQSGLECAVTDIPTSAYPTPATRPLNSRMDCSSTQAAFGIARPDWRQELTLILRELAS